MATSTASTLALLENIQIRMRSTSDVGPTTRAPETDRDVILREFLALDQQNHHCYDCGGTNPTWCSTTYAIMVCLPCSGQHRQKGSHLSFVRSITLDQFTWRQLLRMALGGNTRCRTFLRNNGASVVSGVPMDVNSGFAANYKQFLDERTSKIWDEWIAANASFASPTALTETVALIERHASGQEPATAPQELEQLSQATSTNTTSNVSCTLSEPSHVTRDIGRQENLPMPSSSVSPQPAAAPTISTRPLIAPQVQRNPRKGIRIPMAKSNVLSEPAPSSRGYTLGSNDPPPQSKASRGVDGMLEVASNTSSTYNLDARYSANSRPDPSRRTDQWRGVEQTSSVPEYPTNGGGSMSSVQMPPPSPAGAFLTETIQDVAGEYYDVMAGTAEKGGKRVMGWIRDYLA